MTSSSVAKRFKVKVLHQDTPADRLRLDLARISIQVNMPPPPQSIGDGGVLQKSWFLCVSFGWTDFRTYTGFVTSRCLAPQ
jgi:hypothetical protein